MVTATAWTAALSSAYLNNCRVAMVSPAWARRSPSADLRLEGDSEVSALHAQVEFGNRLGLTLWGRHAF